MGCPTCGRGFHDECYSGECSECHADITGLVENFKKTVIGGIGAPLKEPEDIRDPHSTGRKRAALQYPIFKDEPCDWRAKKNCGGGLKPIVGCINGFQLDRHHGPVKNTLRNEPTNIHRICKPCHNRWHAVNDPIYDEALYDSLPHRPEPADEMELLLSEAKWKMKAKGQTND